MRVLVISDIHENFHNLKLCLDYAIENGVEGMFALGDYMNSGIVHKIAERNLPTFAVLGNHDGDKFEIVNAAQKYNNLTLADLYLETAIDGRNVFLTHDSHIGRLIAQAQNHDAVFSGHDHQAKSEYFGATLHANPGEITGHMFGRSTFGIWNTKDNSFQLYKITEGWVDVKSYKRNGNAGVRIESV